MGRFFLVFLVLLCVAAISTVQILPPEDDAELWDRNSGDAVEQASIFCKQAYGPEGDEPSRQRCNARANGLLERGLITSCTNSTWTTVGSGMDTKITCFPWEFLDQAS
jgi:hypothetical protein